MNLDKTFSYTEDMECYLQENKKSKMIFGSNFWNVNGMEFEHVVIMVSQSEYFLQVVPTARYKQMQIGSNISFIA